MWESEGHEARKEDRDFKPVLILGLDPGGISELCTECLPEVAI